MGGSLAVPYLPFSSPIYTPSYQRRFLCDSSLILSADCIWRFVSAEADLGPMEVDSGTPGTSKPETGVQTDASGRPKMGGRCFYSHLPRLIKVLLTPTLIATLIVTSVIVVAC